MTAITHQQIAERLHELQVERIRAAQKADAAMDAERTSLQEFCGGIGHIWTGGGEFASMPTESECTGRWCCVCGYHERKAA